MESNGRTWATRSAFSIGTNRSGRSEPLGAREDAARLVRVVPAGVRDHLLDEVGPDHQHAASLRKTARAASDSSARVSVVTSESCSQVSQW